MDEYETLEFAASIGRGRAPFKGHQPMPKPCMDCPFVAELKGQGYLHPERMHQIRWNALAGQPFYCHKTIGKAEEDVTWHSDYRVCAGAIEFAEEWFRTHPAEEKEKAE